MDKQSLITTNLYTFNIAAQSLSFTQAAEQLHLTQGAISQRIKQLEQQLGFKLFVRMTRQLQLTKEGLRLYETVNQAFSDIFSDIDDIQSNELSGELYIGVAPTFAESWLMQRLASFQKQYPNLNLKIRVKSSPLDFKHEPVDLAIYYSKEPPSDLHSERLLEEQLTPICTPKFAKQHHIDGQLDSLQNTNFIHCTESIDYANIDYEWQFWLSHNQQFLPEQARYYVFNHSETSVSAVRNHMGIGIGRLALIQHYLDNGELISPFKTIPADMSYWLICPKGMENRPKFQAFTLWLHGQTKVT